jgi:hypothetical protein
MCHINTIAHAVLICILAILSVPKYAQTIVQSDIFTTVQIYTFVDTNNSQYSLLVDCINNFTRYGEFELYFREKNDTNYSLLYWGSTSSLITKLNDLISTIKELNENRTVFFIKATKVKKI